MLRHIAHLDIPDFYAALEELRHPEWKKRPLALAENGPRAVLQGVNGIARTEGLQEGMSLHQARRICRRLLTTAPDARFYKDQHQRILENLGFFSPLVEGSLLGHYFVDLTGTKRLWGPGPDVACRLERRLAEQNGLHARIGLAANKLISQVAANCIPPGDLSCIFPGGETSFFAPLPVTFLPGVGPKTNSRLADFNIQQIGQLAALPLTSLTDVFGKAGSRLLRLAKGIDATPVLPFQKVPHLSVIHNLDGDEIDRERLAAILFQQIEEAGWQLRRHNRYPGRFALEVRYADGNTVKNQGQLPPITTQVDGRLFRIILPFFQRLIQRRVAVRRLVLEFYEFSMPLRQMSLFSWEEAPLRGDLALQQALDDIRGRFGRRSIAWGRTHVPALASRKAALVGRPGCVSS
jgi:DNA polymerase IV